MTVGGLDFVSPPSMRPLAVFVPPTRDDEPATTWSLMVWVIPCQQIQHARDPNYQVVPKRREVNVSPRIVHLIARRSAMRGRTERQPARTSASCSVHPGESKIWSTEDERVTTSWRSGSSGRSQTETPIVRNVGPLSARTCMVPGALLAVASLTLPPGVIGSENWEETFDKTFLGHFRDACCWLLLPLALLCQCCC